MKTKLIILFVLFPVQIFAAEMYEFYTGVRGLGMGGAQIATVNDETALLVNPAALGKLRDYFITVADPEIELGDSTQALVGADVYGMPKDPQAIFDKLNTGTNSTERFHVKGQLFPSIIFPNFGFGVYTNYISDAEIYDADADTLDDYEFIYRNDFAAVFGFNFRIWDGRIKLGFNIKAINRVEANYLDSDITTPGPPTGLLLDNLVSEGFGIASDVGLILTAPWKLLPTLSAVYRNVGNTRFDMQNGMFFNSTTRPQVAPASLDVALALFPIMGKKTRTSFSVEYRDAMDAFLIQDSSKKIHAGIEVNVADALFIRGGMHQRYWSAGLELAIANYQLQFASYGEEVGTVTTNKESRRYVGKFAWRF